MNWKQNGFVQENESLNIIAMNSILFGTLSHLNITKEATIETPKLEIFGNIFIDENVKIVSIIYYEVNGHVIDYYIILITFPRQIL